MNYRTLLVLLLCCCFGAAARDILAQNKRARKNPIVVEFLKHIRSKDLFVRRDQVERLAKVQTPQSVQLLVSLGLNDPEEVVRAETTRSLGHMTDAAARAAVLGFLKNSSAAVRRGICLSLGRMKEPPKDAIPALSEILLQDRVPSARVAAAQALGMLDDARGSPALIQALADKNYEVLIATLDSLSLLKPKEAATPAAKALKHPNWRVQVAALNALGRIRGRATIGPIVAYMGEARGRPRQDARRALVRITHRTFGMRVKDWQEWWARTATSGWKVPPERTGGKEARPPENEDPGRGYSRHPIRYHHILTYSRKVLFVLDISTSMKAPILVARGRDTGSRRLADVATQKLKLAREELAFTLRGLDKNTRFNVMVFETNVRIWKKTAQKASPGTVQAAIRWIEHQKPYVPATGLRASSGVDSHGRLLGRTNSYAALRAVFGLPVEGRGGITPGGRKKRKVLWDTCFFLTDGDPTVGEFVKPEDILDEVRRWNKVYKIRINCIGMNATGSLRNFLDGLARLTGGKAVYLGK